MSTYATADGDFHASAYDDPEQPRIVRVSTCLSTGDVGLDVETPDDYDRTVLEPAAARDLAHKLLWAADAGDKIRRS